MSESSQPIQDLQFEMNGKCRKKLPKNRKIYKRKKLKAIGRVYFRYARFILLIKGAEALNKDFQKTIFENLEFLAFLFL